MKELAAGLTGEMAWTVTEEMTAARCGSGLLPVFSTPMLIALMEGAACDALKGCLPEGSTSVGIEMNVKHLAPSDVGAQVHAEAKLTEIDGRILSFELNAYDVDTLIGTALHKRAVIDAERFMAKLKSR